jgi:purine-binding chemotaxis protein CheW
VQEAPSVIDDTFLTFLVDTTPFAVSTGYIQEVIDYPSDINLLPLAPPFIEGVFKLRNIIIPLVDLKSLLGLPPTKNSTDQVGILTFQDYLIGIRVSHADEVIQLSIGDMVNIDDRSEQIISGFIRPTGSNKIYQVLTPQNIFKLKEIPKIHNALQSRSEQYLGINLFTGKQMICFESAKITLAFRLELVQEIAKETTFTIGPVVGKYYLGQMNLRGNGIDVFDLNKYFGIESEHDENEESNIVIINKNGKEFGIRVFGRSDIQFYDSSRELNQIPIFKDFPRQEAIEGAIVKENKQIIFLIKEDVIFQEPSIQGVIKVGELETSKATEKKVKEIVKSSLFLTFQCDQEFAMPVSFVREITRNHEVALPPGKARFMAGVLNLRGKSIPLIDFRSVYQMEHKPVETGETIVMEYQGEEYGILVDSVTNIVNVYEDEVLPLGNVFKANSGDRVYVGDIDQVFKLKHGPDNQHHQMILNIDKFFSNILGDKA